MEARKLRVSALVEHHLEYPYLEEAQIFHLGTKIIWEWSLVDQLINIAT